MEELKGKLAMKNLCFSRFDFKQKVDVKGSINIKCDFEVVYKKITDKSQIVKIITHLIGDEERLILNIEEQAEVELINAELLDDKTREVILNQNSVAIMFPYLRSQVALLTTQPGLSTFQLPIIDVRELIKNARYE